ncbi:protein of unknown function [Verrucomicrobium sp. GAS474]|uniref:DUF1844 domain-containing protein n=1 Tax=Verrucomicrobium sp. GAS474 TaxID=1882831 RepID=UPI00087B978D|nr:DUF1844 domain-containing protein [Verrucomicrobium sp. GAS474]SDU06714.1 protein of unknown function [Verrucomicrobium sp. GAS474]
MSEPESSLAPHEVSQIFAQMVMMQAQNALYLLGRIPDNSGRPIPPQLPEAKMLIDQLEALQIKTKGNLIPQEEKLVAKVLTEIRLAFVEASGGTPASMMPGHHSAAYGAGDPYAQMEEDPLPGDEADASEPPPFLARQEEPEAAPKPAPAKAPAPEPAAPKEPEKEKKYFKSYG